MKFVAIVIVAMACLVAADDDWKPIVDRDTKRQIHNDCMKESGLTEEQKAKIIEKKRVDEKEVYDYVLCHVKRVGIFSEESGFIIDRLVKHIATMNYGDKETAQMIVQKCVDKNEQKSTPGEWAQRGIECMYDFDPDKEKENNNIDKE